MTRRRTLVREINPHLICVLCSGYFIEATTIVECLHSFCRSCLVKYLEKNKFCPICDVQLHKNNPLLSVRCDSTLQQLVYKLIPGLYGREMARRQKYYSELGGPSSDPDCGVFPVADAYFSPEDSISLSLEFVNFSTKVEESNDHEEASNDKLGIHHRRYLQCPAAVTMPHLKKFLRMKYGLCHDHNVDIIYGDNILTDDFSLMDVAYTFSWSRAAPMRFKFRFLQKNSFAQVMPSRNVCVPSKDSKTNETEVKKEHQLKVGNPTVQIKRLNCDEATKMEPTNIKRNELEPMNGDLKRPLLQVKSESEPAQKKIKILEPVRSSDKLEERIIKREREKQEEKIRRDKEEKMLKKEKEEKLRKMREKEKQDEKLRKEKEKQEEKLRKEKEKIELKAKKEREEALRKERERAFEKLALENIKKRSKDKYNYIDDIEEDEVEDDRLQITASAEDEAEDMVVEEPVDEPIKDFVVLSKSEERRKEKKKNKKAKHHHHHRHHERKRDSPPAATILHSPENDIMKLKIKLTEINPKPKYSVVDVDDRKEVKENGYHKSDKYSERFDDKQKHKEEMKKNNESLINNNNNETCEEIGNTKNKTDKSKDEKIALMRNIRNKSASHSPSPKPSLSPKVQQAKPVVSKQNGTIKPEIKMETIKMPPSSITVSKITAEEKRQMEQQKLFMNRNNNNSVDSKRPSLEIMLVNAPKKNADDVKPVEVKKVIRPTPPSIPLSRLGKNVNFGMKNSPPPLVPAAKNSHDETGALDLSGKSSRKSPEIESAMRNLVTLSDTAVHVRSLMSQEPTLKIPVPQIGLNNKSGIQLGYQSQRTIKPLQNQSVRQIPNPSALMFRQHGLNGRAVPPPVVPINSLRKMESMTKNIEKVAAGLSVKAAVEAGLRN